MKYDLPALPRRDDVLVDTGAAAPKACLSPVRGDAYATSRWWLTSHRQNLYSDDDHLSLAASLVRSDQIDENYDFSIHHGQKQFLNVQVIRNKIDENSGFRSNRLYRSSTRLSVFGSVARVALWGGSSSGHRAVP